MVKKFSIIQNDQNTAAYQKIMNWYFSYPQSECTLNELVKNLKISKTTASKAVNELIQKDFLKKKVFGKTWSITCNQQHQYNYTKKIAYNLAMILELYEQDLRDAIIDSAGNSKAIILFGSYRKGDDNETSDLDIAVEVSKDKKDQIIELGIVPELGYRKNVPINLHIFNQKNVDINLFANIANGIVLSGFLEVKPKS